MKKFLVCALAFVMLLGVASAEKTFTDGINDGKATANGSDWVYEFDGGDDAETVRATLDKAASVTITFTINADEADKGFGGALVCNTSAAGANGNNWDAVEWGNADKDTLAVATGNANEYTISRDVTGLLGSKEDQYGVYNKVCIQSWWGADMNVTSLVVKDASGAAIYSAGAKAPAKDEAGKTGDAMNMIVIAGLAVIALAGAVVVANKKNA